MRKSLIYFFLTAFVSMNLLTGFCLAAQKHSCCPSQKAVKCPMQSVQKAASPKGVKALKSPSLKSAPVPKPAQDKRTAPTADKHSEAPNFILPNYHLSASIDHQTNAPPQA